MKQKILDFWYNHWCPIVILTFVLLFFGKIVYNTNLYLKDKAEFKIKCEAKGGIMFTPQGVRGFPVPECRNPNYNISLE